MDGNPAGCFRIALLRITSGELLPDRRAECEVEQGRRPVRGCETVGGPRHQQPAVSGGEAFPFSIDPVFERTLQHQKQFAEIHVPVKPGEDLFSGNEVDVNLIPDLLRNGGEIDFVHFFACFVDKFIVLTDRKIAQESYISNGTPLLSR